MRRRTVLAGTVAVVAVAGGATAMALQPQAAPSAAAAAPAATAEVTRSDLVDEKAVDGTLGYSGQRAQPNKANGTVTRAREEGTTVRRGGWLYHVDARPIILIYGNIPIYRELSTATSGKDVRQLERNLKALGHDPGTVDDDFTWQTREAVLDWQEDQGLAETGTVDATQVIVAAGPVRVAKVTAEVGSPAGQSAVTTSTTSRVVQVDLSAADQELARIGANVTIDLPGGATAKGRVASIGTVAQAVEEGQEATIDVEVTLRSKVGRLDQAPVTVNLQSEKRAGVLSVPVEALLALYEGGYGVRVVDGAAARIVPVETGLFAGGRVEVSGDGLAEGAKVEVPAT